jgi:hypothetical protein
VTALVHVVIFYGDDQCRVITNTDKLGASAFAEGFAQGASMFSREPFHGAPSRTDGAVTIIVLPGDEDELAFIVRMRRITPVQVDRMHALIADAEAKLARLLSPGVKADK